MASDEIDILFAEDSRSDTGMTLRTPGKRRLINNLAPPGDGREAPCFPFTGGNFAGRYKTVQPKVIFPDLKMPRRKRPETRSVIKAELNTKNIRVGLLTPTGEAPNNKKCSWAGVNNQTVKPFNILDLMQTGTQPGLFWTTNHQIPAS